MIADPEGPLLHHSYSWAPPLRRRRFRDTRPTSELATAMQQSPERQCARLSDSLVWSSWMRDESEAAWLTDFGSGARVLRLG
jgi:hypothetical protein